MPVEVAVRRISVVNMLPDNSLLTRKEAVLVAMLPVRCD